MANNLEDTDKVPAVREAALTEDPTNPHRNDPLPPYGAPPPQYMPEERGGNCGCWIAGVMSLLVALLLVGVGLFLPPVNLYDRLFGTQYAMLDATNNAIRTNDGGLAMVLDTADVGRDFGVNLNTVSLEDFQNVNAQAAEWIPAANAAVPPYLVLQSAVYDIQTTGTSPDSVTFDVQLPANVSNTDTLDVYGYDISSGRWTFLASQENAAGSLTVTASRIPDRIGLFQAGAPAPTVIVPVEITQALSEEASRVATVVAPAGMQPVVDGSLVGSLAPGFDPNAGYRVMPLVRNFLDPLALDPGTVTTIISNRTLRNTHVQQLLAFASNSGFDGVFIDYRGLSDSDRENFALFISELKNAFRNSQLLVGVVVPAAQNAEGTWNTGAYDWRAIGDSADYVQVDFPLDPLTFTPGEDRLIEAMLRWGVGEVSRYKLIAGLNALSVREVGGEYLPVGYNAALAALGDVEIQAEANEKGFVEPGSVISASLNGLEAVPGLDTQVGMPFVEYLNEDGTKASAVWLMTGNALRARLDRFDTFALGGVAFADLNAEGVADGVVQSILNYKVQMPNTTEQGELALRWRVESADGVVEQEYTTKLNEDLTVTLEAVEGNFAINVEVISGENSVVRSGAAVAQFLPTPTLTPTPEPTITPTFTPTNTLQPIVPTAESPSTAGGQPPVVSGGGGPAVQPGAGSIAGGFEYGGHVTSTSSQVATSAMQQAGMTWMKVQVRYFPGKNPGDVASVISDAKGRGFKILLGIVGDPNELAAGGAGYISSFAQYLGGVAALGPDAIEVWNEPNLAREWPEGSISGANYTSMLSQAYQAIKGANGSVMVISGAPAPTGAEAAFPGRVVNDNNFLTQMVQAGAMNYMDCVGVHYNEGIIPPNQTTGDPRDAFYSRYFFGMVDTYWSITGGVKPLCFTELGYLTSEGYGPLPDFFAWAQNVTVAQQSAWLAQAISLASQSGKVRMVIVWNIDFTVYGADPQGGYAIVRPGGGCPACAAIAAAR
jgi:hypothetical protein